MEYESVNETNIAAYLLSIPGLFSDGASLIISEIGDGNINFVYQAKDTNTGKSVIVKQAMPYLRSSGKNRLLTTDRIRIEAEAMAIQGSFCPQFVPKIFHQDHERALFVMEDLSNHVIMRKGLIDGKQYPNFAEHIGVFMAQTLYKTSDFFLDGKEKKAMQARFINPEMCEITEKLIFTVPYYDDQTTHYMPESQAAGEALRRNDALKFEVALLKESFLTNAQALIHGDLHTGSVFVTDQTTKAIDQEFAFYGPMGFDLGLMIGNLVLNYAAHEYHSQSADQRMSHRQYLLETIHKTWDVFSNEFSRLWESFNQETTAGVKGYKDHFIHRLLSDGAGFAGCETIRRIGRAQVEDFRFIPDESVRADAERMALRMGEAMIMKRRDMKNGIDLVNIIEQAAHNLK